MERSSMRDKTDETYTGYNPFRRFQQGRTQGPVPGEYVEDLVQETIATIEQTQKSETNTQSVAQGQKSGNKSGISKLFERFSRSEQKVNEEKKNKKFNKRETKLHSQGQVVVKTIDNKKVSGIAYNETLSRATHGDMKKCETMKGPTEGFKLSTYNYKPPKPCLTRYQRQKIILAWALRQPKTSDYEKLLISVMKDLDEAGDIFNEKRPINKIYAKSYDGYLNMVTDSQVGLAPVKGSKIVFESNSNKSNDSNDSEENISDEPEGITKAEDKFIQKPEDVEVVLISNN